jgi:hypothetical protein
MKTSKEQTAQCGVEFKTNAVRIGLPDGNFTYCSDPEISAFGNL